MITSRPLLDCVRRFAILPAAVACVSLWGCGQRLDKNPLFQDQLHITERLDEDSKAMSRQVDELALDIRTIKQQMTGVAKAPQLQAAQLRSYEDRIAQLEKTVADSTAQLAALNTRAHEPKAAPVPAANLKEPVLEKPKSETPKENIADAKPTKSKVVGVSSTSSNLSTPSTKSLSTAPKGKITKSASGTDERAPAGGFYYNVQRGETFELIAQKNKIGVNTLLTANRIPPGKSLLAGQQIYVPAGH